MFPVTKHGIRIAKEAQPQPWTQSQLNEGSSPDRLPQNHQILRYVLSKKSRQYSPVRIS